MWTSAALCAALVLSGGSPARAASVRASSARKGADWLVSQQQPNGAFFKTTERVDETAEHLVAVVAGGVEGNPVEDALDYIASKGKAGATRGAFTGRIIAGIVAAGADPTDHGDVDYVAILKDQYSSNGAYDKSQFFDNLLGANGALAAGLKLPANAVDYIATNECDGGGFGYDSDCPKGPDVDTTSWAINVLDAAHQRADIVTRARAWLVDQQHEDGGFAFTKDIQQTSSDSTGLALSAIEALGDDATRSPWQRPNGNDPVEALRNLQHASGGFRFVAGAKPNGFSTRQAVVGMAKLAYPVPPMVAPTRTPAPDKEPEATERPESTEAPATARASAEPEATGEASAALDLASAAPTASPTMFADSFTGPDEVEEDDGGSILTNPILWAGVAGTGIGTGVALWFRRRRMLL